MQKSAIFIVFFLVMQAYCLLGDSRGQNSVPEGYRVMSYDGATHQWVILRNGTFDGKYMVKRITVACSSCQWVNHELLSGPEVCQLQVGQMLVPKRFPDKDSEFLDVFEMSGDTLVITEGKGDDQVQQQFKILKYEVLPDK